MNRDLVVGLDSSTTAAKAIAWTRAGTIAAECRGSISLASPAANWYEQDAGEWWSAACTALRGVVDRVGAGRIAAIAIANQRETFVPIDAAGHPVRPAIVWLDQRASSEVAWLSEAVGARRIHEITGKPVDMAPVAYRLAWMLHHEANRYAQTAMFADVHAYLVWRLSGRWATSCASADPLGLFDMRPQAWSEEILRVLELDAAQLPDVAAPGTVLALVNECAAAGTGLAPGTPVVAGGGDGQAAGLGVNILKPERAYLNLGTAVVSGIHAPDYRIGQAWRTMSCCSGEGYIFETSLRSGTMLLDWFVTMCGAGQDGAEARRRLEEEAAGLATGSAGLLAVPYWGAVMTPYWDTAARGCFVGLTPAHRPAHLYRALMEGIAMEQAMVMGMIEQETGTRVREIVAIGGGAASDPWCRILANACGVPLKRSQTVEASSLGAAMCAAAGAGWFRSVAEAAEAMSGTLGRETAPDPHGQARLAELLAIYREVYPSLRDTHRRLARFVAAE